MTVTEAIVHARTLTKRDDTPHTLTQRERDAIQKLIEVAIDARFSPQARQRLIWPEPHGGNGPRSKT
jgi:phage terminase small subunit